MQEPNQNQEVPESLKLRVKRINRALSDFPGAKKRLAERLSISQSAVSSVLTGRYMPGPDFERAALKLISDLQREAARKEDELERLASRVLD